MSTLNIILLLTALTTSLSAGLFYSYACSVNPGLAAVSDSQYIAAMQAINKAILNPVFFFSFIGTLILLPVSTYQQYTQGDQTRFYLLFAATLIYATGTFGVTVLGNVPLNNALEKFDLASATAEQISAQRQAFGIPWNRLHLIRTVANIAALVLVLTSLLSKTEKLVQ